MARIQIIAIAISVLFLLYIVRLIVKGKLREEYSIVWIVCTIVLVLFSCLIMPGALSLHWVLRIDSLCVKVMVLK